MTKEKLGRNDPCHCGSGKKYKKCHLRIEESLPKALELMAAKRRDQIEYEKKFGKTRPMMGADFQGYKFVVEGSKIHYSKDVKTPADSLEGYLKQILGKDWWQTECKKEPSQRTPVVQWAYRKSGQQNSGEKAVNGLYFTEFVWPMWQYFILSRDLHAIRDHSAYEKKLLTALRRENHFLGARNELFAASSLIRAGFKIEWENSKGVEGKKPVEFVATNAELGETVAVECKARNVLSADPDVRSFLNDAFLKDTPHPLVIFVDLLVSPFAGEMRGQPWFKNMMPHITDGGWFGRQPFPPFP